MSPSKSTKSTKAPKEKPAKSAVWTADSTTAVVRYQVRDVDHAAAFYSRHLGFEVVGRPGPVAILRRGDLHLVLSGPGASGSRSAGGDRQEPGGWNRIVLYFDEIAPAIASLESAGAKFRNELEVGPGGKQIQVDDPDGNPIELHEAPRK